MVAILSGGMVEAKRTRIPCPFSSSSSRIAPGLATFQNIRVPWQAEAYIPGSSATEESGSLSGE
ncbi:hypothetical protein IT40_26495 [Paracoccus versutus]|nr:hypothetical protein IT40_26495 [Paracoccus versutus]